MFGVSSLEDRAEVWAGGGPEIPRGVESLGKWEVVGSCQQEEQSQQSRVLGPSECSVLRGREAGSQGCRKVQEARACVVHEKRFIARVA